MKKIFITILMGIMILAMCSCGTVSPTETVDQFMTAYKAKDNETAQAVYSGKVDAFAKSFDGYGATVADKILGFEYNIVEENIDGEKATVKVEITTYELGKAFEAAAEEMLTAAFAAAFGEMTDEEANEISMKALDEECTKLEKKTYKTTCVINLSLVDDVWMIDEFKENGSFYKAIFGGMIEITESWSAGFNG
ncbi:MAG: hypothetical protein IKJ77_04535 [Firmicutes bacterium]|nr:hypothetical protein [Bacillota bacterium]